MRLLKTSKTKPWPLRLKNVKPGETIQVHPSSISACRQAISRSLPDSGYDCSFETKAARVLIGKKVVRYYEALRLA